MVLRLAFYELSARHKLSAEAASQLEQLAGLRQAPQQVLRYVGLGVAVMAAALGGLGMILWVAAS